MLAAVFDAEKSCAAAMRSMRLPLSFGSIASAAQCILIARAVQCTITRAVECIIARAVQCTIARAVQCIIARAVTVEQESHHEVLPNSLVDVLPKHACVNS